MSDVRTVRSRSMYDGRVVKLRLETVRLPNDNEVELEVIRHVGAAAVVPVDSNGRVLMVRQYRHATGGYLLEVPAGKLDGGESPETCAVREVEEETGYRLDSLTPMGWIFTTPGFTDEKIWLYLATGLEPARQRLERDEVLTVEKIPLKDAVEMAARGDISDAKSICALLRTPRYLIV